MKDRMMAIVLTAYLAILLWINASFLEHSPVIVCFDLGTALILIAAALLGGTNNGRA